MAYVFLASAVLLLSLLVKNNNCNSLLVRKSYDRIITIAILTGIIVFSSIRYDVGRDYLSYLRILENGEYLESRGERGRFEYGYIIINNIINSIPLSKYSLFAFFAFFTMIFINKTLQKYRKFYSFAFFLFFTDGFLFGSFNGMRQYLAIAIFFYSIQYIHKRELLRYLLCIGIASLFHRTALFLLPLFFVLPRKPTRVYILFFVTVSFLLSFFITKIPLDYLFKLSGAYGGYYRLFLSTFKSDFSPVLIVKTILLFGLILRKDNTYNDEITPYLNLYILYIAITIVFSNSWVVARLSEYFKISGLIVIPWIVSTIENRKRRKISLLLIVAFFTLFFCNTIFNSPSAEKITYQTIWDQ